MATKTAPKIDHTLLEMAIIGYESQLQHITAKIAELKAQLGQRGPGRPKASANESNVANPTKRRTISKAGRERIAAAQRARWAAQKKQQTAAKPVAKRKLSAAGLKAIREGTRKRWAAYRQAQAAAA